MLQRVSGYTEFRPGQGEAIESALSGNDTIVVIPTGGGKTIVYTIPCIMTPGISCNVSTGHAYA